MFKTWYSRFCAQPHQSFFANGIVLLFTFSLLLFGVYRGTISLNASIAQMHAYVFVFVIFIQFFLGFLFVVFPKFLVQAAISPQVYMRHFWLYFAVSHGLFIAFLLNLQTLATIFMCLNLFAQILSFRLLFNIHKNSKLADKYDTKWVLVALGFGLVANGLFLISMKFYALQAIAIACGFWLFLFGVVFAITQRMVPFFTSVKVAGYKINKSKFLMEKLFALLSLKLVLSQILATFEFVADGALCLFFVYEIYRWKPIFRGTNAILWVLYLSILWVPIGFLLGFLDGASALLGLGFVFEKSALHAIGLGYFFTILVGFGTRVTLGHSGHTPHADKIATAIFCFTQVVVVSRIFAGVSVNFAFDYSFWLLLSVAIFALALIAWGVRYLPILLKGFDPNEKLPPKPQTTPFTPNKQHSSAINFKPKS